MASVRAVKVKRGHLATVTFTDGSRRDIDFRRYLHGRLFGELLPEARFREIGVQDGAVAWPNGADICPDVLYYDLPLAGEPLTPASSLRLRQFLESPGRHDQGPATAARTAMDEPEVSRFLGITISMHHEKKARPHFHASYAEYGASFTIDSLRKLSGELPPRATGFVREWASLHRKELSTNWSRARRDLPLKPISPLE
jgi:hypothetical protein